MGTVFLILFHISIVTLVYITAYRTGYDVCRDETRRQAEACAAPLTEILEQLNMDVEKLLDDDNDRRA